MRAVRLKDAHPHNAALHTPTKASLPTLCFAPDTACGRGAPLPFASRSGRDPVAARRSLLYNMVPRTRCSPRDTYGVLGNVTRNDNREVDRDAPDTGCGRGAPPPSAPRARSVCGRSPTRPWGPQRRRSCATRSGTPGTGTCTTAPAHANNQNAWESEPARSGTSIKYAVRRYLVTQAQKLEGCTCERRERRH